MFQFPLFQNLTEKVEQHSDSTYSAVKGLGYDEVANKLGLVISQGGADTVIPFESGNTYSFLVMGGQYSSSTGDRITTCYSKADGTVGSGYTFADVAANSELVSACSGAFNSNVNLTLTKGGTYVVKQGHSAAMVVTDVFLAGQTITLFHGSIGGIVLIYLGE